MTVGAKQDVLENYMRRLSEASGDLKRTSQAEGPGMLVYYCDQHLILNSTSVRPVQTCCHSPLARRWDDRMPRSDPEVGLHSDHQVP